MIIRFFGRLADAIGRELRLQLLEPCTISEMRSRLAGEYPSAAAVILSERARAVSNGTVLPDEHVVRDDDEIELLPPVSGG